MSLAASASLVASPKHIEEGRLELYTFGRLPANEEDRIEEHLLVCRACRQQLTEVEEFQAVLIKALPAEVFR